MSLRMYSVGVFPGKPGRKHHAYVRDYNPEWAGCCVHYLASDSGKNAKRQAIEDHLQRCLGRQYVGDEP